MIQALITMAVFAVMAVIFDRKATKNAKGDVRAFAALAIASMLIIGLISEARADEVNAYFGAEYGLDMPIKFDEKVSPQCVEGYQDDWTSQGRIYAGIEWGDFYFEAYPWMHKSCAMGEDFNVYDGMGFLIGGRIEFNLLH